MKLDFKTQTLTLESVEMPTDGQSARCWVNDGDRSHEYFAETIHTPSKEANALLAFNLASQIAQDLLRMTVQQNEFSVVPSGHMVKLGDYDSLGANPEKSKEILRSGDYNDINTVEFYLRRSLLALNHQQLNIKKVSAPRKIYN